jgi:transcription-repair coupling factor (superfamily II helicase)
VEVFPAWETLPFERVSPDIFTMGRRLRVLWQLGGLAEGLTPGAPGPEVLVAPIKAVLQRLGPWRSASRPVVVAKGDRVDADALTARLVEMGYRRESLVEHRGELAVRGGIVDVFPSTADEPIRIDLWGDEVDRLTRFDVADQRSTDDLDRVELFGCRELVADETMRKRASELVGSAPWGRHQWDRLADGEQFDGMESWLPWLVDSEELVTDLVGDDAVVVLVEPRRVRDRAGELLDEESALADALATTWGLDAGEGAPRLHVPFDRLLTDTSAGVVSLVPSAEGPDIPLVESRGWEPILGDGARLASQVSSLVNDGYSVVLCSSTPGGAERLAGILAAEGITVPVASTVTPISTPVGDAAREDPDLARPGARIVVAPWIGASSCRGQGGACWPSPTSPGGAGRTARPGPGPSGRRVLRRPGPGELRGPPPARGGHLRGHGHPDHGRATRDYLLLEYRGGDKLYLPTDQIELLTPYAGGDSPTVSRLGGSEWQRARSRARAAVHEIAEELVALYRRRLQVTGHAFGPDTPWQAELETSFPFVETADQVRAIEEVKADMERPQPMDRLVCGDVGFGKTEVAIRAVFKAVQDGYQVAVLVPTTLLASQHAQTFADRYAPFPVKVEC